MHRVPGEPWEDVGEDRRLPENIYAVISAPDDDRLPREVLREFPDAHRCREGVFLVATEASLEDVFRRLRIGASDLDLGPMNGVVLALHGNCLGRWDPDPSLFQWLHDHVTFGEGE